MFSRLEDARRTLSASLGELIAEGAATPAQIVDSIGFADLERFLSPEERQRALEAAVRSGRRGEPFDDVALLNAVTPAAIARALPLGRLEDVLDALRSREGVPIEHLGDDDLAPPSVAMPGLRPSHAPTEHDELDPDSVELLPPSIPGHRFADDPTKQ